MLEASAGPGRGRRRVAISGASGLIGSRLAAALREDGYTVVPMVRSTPGAGEVGWDPARGRIDAPALEGLEAVVHLAGEPVDGRWTAEKKARIRSSRVDGTRLLAGALAALRDPPKLFLSASAVGYYGDRGDERLDETSPPGDNFLAEVVREWEAATQPVARAGIRTVTPRLGVVLAPEGGALEKMLPIFRLGGGGTLASGRQWMSWVSIDDLLGAFRFIFATPELSGPVNVVAPEPVTNAEFTRALGKALGRPALLTVPAFALRLVYGEMAEGALLTSQRVFPDRLLRAGFVFRHPRVGEALRAILKE